MIFGVSPGLTIASHTDVMRPVFAFSPLSFSPALYDRGKPGGSWWISWNCTPIPQRPKASISLRLPNDWLERIDALRGRSTRTRTALILQCIDFAGASGREFLSV